MHSRFTSAAGLLHRQRDPEIRHQPRAFVKQDVRSPDVPVDHPPTVRVLQRLGDFPRIQFERVVNLPHDTGGWSVHLSTGNHLTLALAGDSRQAAFGFRLRPGLSRVLRRLLLRQGRQSPRVPMFQIGKLLADEGKDRRAKHTPLSSVRGTAGVPLVGPW